MRLKRGPCFTLHYTTSVSPPTKHKTRPKLLVALVFVAEMKRRGKLLETTHSDSLYEYQALSRKRDDGGESSWVWALIIEKTLPDRRTGRRKAA